MKLKINKFFLLFFVLYFVIPAFFLRSFFLELYPDGQNFFNIFLFLFLVFAGPFELIKQRERVGLNAPRLIFLYLVNLVIVLIVAGPRGLFDSFVLHASAQVVAVVLVLGITECIDEIKKIRISRQMVFSTPQKPFLHAYWKEQARGRWKQLLEAISFAFIACLFVLFILEEVFYSAYFVREPYPWNWVFLLYQCITIGSVMYSYRKIQG